MDMSPGVKDVNSSYTFPLPTGPVKIGEYDTAFRESIAPRSQHHLGFPVAEVRIKVPFEVGRAEVTYEQYDYYVWKQQRGAKSYKPKFPTMAEGGRGRCPVVNVDWHEADRYARWLGKQLKPERTCRLPTEAEWEYTARANSKTAYPWGNEIGDNLANCCGCSGRQYSMQAAPVESFGPNAFGLYDTSGNVWEWTCSRWQDKFAGEEQRCIEPSEPEERRAVRGGSWVDGPTDVRSAARNDYYPRSANNNVGFRVLCLSSNE